MSRQARGQEHHLAVDRGFHEGLVDHDRADDAKVHAGKARFRLPEATDRANSATSVTASNWPSLRQFDRDVDDADIAVRGPGWLPAMRGSEEANGPYSRPGLRIGSDSWRIDEIPHVQVVAVGGGVLKVGERVDAPRKGRLPGRLP